ncbi:MAG: hypothetical protein PUC29_04985 [Clostridia bacterium]|nr:hypothetical protein [Clostridia bacterium]
MISYTVFFILSAVLLFGLIKKKKKIFAVIGVCTEVALLCLIILGLLGISLTPLAFLILNIAVALWCLIEMYILFFKSAKITVIVASALCVLFIAATVFYYPAFLKRTVDGTDYMAVYSKWTGISETKVSYHHMYNSLFMSSDASYTENYGILFCGWEDVFNYEPYSVSNDDGVIDPEKLENLEDMLSKLNTNTTMQDVVSIFGKAPRMKPETNSDSWEYYCGDTTITLTGINNQDGTLFQAVVNDRNSSYELDLTDSHK